MSFFDGQWTDSYVAPSISFAIIILALSLTFLILWRRYHSRQLLLQRVHELERLSAAGRAIVAAELDVAALCELIAQESGQVIDNSTFQVGLFEDNLYHILFWTINGKQQETPRTFDLKESSGLVSWVRESRQPLLVRDFNKELDTLPIRPRIITQTPPRSAIFIPLIRGDDVIGMISAQHSQPNRFNQEDMRRLMILANQAAAAIAHAHLYAQERQRAAHLELVGQIARRINSIQEQEEIFDQVTQLIRQTFGFHPVSIFLLEKGGELVLKSSSYQALPDNRAAIPSGQGLIGTAVATQQTIVSHNTSEDTRFLPIIAGVEQALPTQSEMAIPLLMNGEVLGVLDVQSPHRGAFSPADKTALEALAAEVAIAIEKSRQLARQREQSWMTAARLQVAETIGRSADLDELITAVVHLTPMLAGVPFCAVLLWDEETAVYRLAAANGIDQEIKNLFDEMELSIGDWPALDAVHVGQQPMSTQRIPAWLLPMVKNANSNPSQVTLMPMCTVSQLIGVLLVTEPETMDGSNWSHRLQNRRDELLYNVAQQTAQAVESAYLRRAQQEEAWVNTALLQVAEAVNSLTELDEILDTIVRLVPMLVGVESALILIGDDHQQVFHPGPSYGVTPMGRGLLETLKLDWEEFASFLPQVAGSLTPTSSYYAFRPPHWLEQAMGTPHTHAFPLNARGRMVGVMVVGGGEKDGRSFSARRLNILNGIAHQAATAVVNNQLYKESAERSRLEQELNVAREIQASLMPAGNPRIPGCSVASFWQAARQVSGDFYDFLALPGGKWGIVVADVADKGVPAALLMALSRTILRTVAFSRINPAEVLTRVNEIIDKDAQSELFVTIFYAVWNPQKETLTYANAGHNPPLLIRRNGKSRQLQGHGIALGVLPNVEIEGRTIRLHQGDVLIFYTDGVTEAMNEDLDEFGLGRLRVAAKSSRSQDASHIVQAITTAISNHAGNTPQSDDITLVVMKREA